MEGELPTPGVLGRILRLALGLAVGFMGVGLVRNAPGFFDGITWSMHVFPFAAVIVVFSSWVINELTGKNWGWKPLLFLVAGAALATGISFATGAGAFGPIFGIYFWAWSFAFVVLLAPALLLAFVLGTPGCEMRSYAHLQAKMGGKDPATVTCPGWIDRLDAVRIFGK